MNSLRYFHAALLGTLLLTFSIDATAQLVVNNKNINDDKELTYIQLMYYIDKGTLRPVFYVDHGYIEPDYKGIIYPNKDSELQKIAINGEEVGDRVTVVWMLNKLHKAGWEYIGDVVYVPIPMMDKWTIFTLRRSRLVTEYFGRAHCPRFYKGLVEKYVVQGTIQWSI